MLKTVSQAPEDKRVIFSHHPLKLTALLYLKEALWKERYEICAEIVATAKEFGARAFEVQDLLEDPRRTPG